MYTSRFLLYSCTPQIQSKQIPHFLLLFFVLVRFQVIFYCTLSPFQSDICASPCCASECVDSNRLRSVLSQSSASALPVIAELVKYLPQGLTIPPLLFWHNKDVILALRAFKMAIMYSVEDYDLEDLMHFFVSLADCLINWW